MAFVQETDRPALEKEAGSSLKQNEQPRETEAEERSQGAHPAEELPCWQLELGNLQADFLQAGLDLQREDVLVSKEIFELERNLARLASGEEMAEGERRWEMLCPACTGIGPENCRKCLADCFEITGFHAQSPNGRVVIRLHVLRSRLRKLERELPDRSKGNGTLYHQPIITDDLPWVWRKKYVRRISICRM